jgi:type VI secretion system secreted protein Hcp
MAAVDYFLKIEGIPGESQDAKHTGEIEVTAWSWGEAAAGQGAPGGAGGGAGKVQLQDLHFTARISKASPKLMQACASGQHIKSAVLTGRRAGNQGAEFLTYSLSDVLVSSFQTGDGEDNVAPLDSVALGFGRIQVEYRETKPDGSLGGAVKFGWDVKQNKKV